MYPPKIENAPGLRWQARKGGILVAIWRARNDLVARGYRPRNAHVWRGAGLDEGAILRIQSECQRMQNEMLAWSRGGRRETALFNGTFGSLIDVYLSDPDSSFHELRYRSRRDYQHELTRLKRLEGTRTLSALGFRDFRNWYLSLRYPQGKSGPDHASTAHQLMGKVRIVVNFGAMMELAHCVRLSQVLSRMEFPNARPRTQEIDRQMATAIIKAAHECGRPSIALAQAIQFELILRQKDVIGEWVPMEEPGISLYQERGKKWLVGILWSEIDDNLILKHTLSKSIRGRDGIVRKGGKVMEFDLKLYPLVMAELANYSPQARTGALIKNERTGIPYRSWQFSDAWREIADKAGVPREVRNMDSRAGGITEGAEASGDLEKVRKAAGHQHEAQTQKYSRGNVRATAEIAVLRANKGETDKQ